MPTYDLGVLDGTLLTSTGRFRAHLYVDQGRIAAITSERHQAKTSVDADGLCVFPGMVDSHVHLMDPGDPAREDFPTGTAAAAASGVTTIIEHTHGHPVRTVDDLLDKRHYLSSQSNVDFGLAAHVFSDNLEELATLWQAGISFFKLFTCTTHGIPGLDAANIYQAFEKTAALAAPCLVHCEDESLTRQVEALLKQEQRDDAAVIPQWRSREAELVATAVTCLLAELTQARVAIAHVSHPAVCEIVESHRLRGARLAAEACPQYFFLREQEILDQGPYRKFTPPARARSDGDEAAMWELLRQGQLTHFSTDHAPATREQKEARDIWDAPFGLPGLDTTFALLLDAALRGLVSFEDVVYRYAEVPARWYGLYPRKANLTVGADADLVLVDPKGERTLTDAQVISKAGWSPYSGRALRGQVVGAYLRGELIGDRGKPVQGLTGRFLPGPGASPQTP